MKKETEENKNQKNADEQSNSRSDSEDAKFIKVLKKIMADRNLKQLSLAEVLGIRQSQISNWLNGKSQPTYASLQNIKDKLKVRVEDFFE